MQFAGCWEDFNDEDFHLFSKDIAKRRKAAFSKREKLNLSFTDTERISGEIYAELEIVIEHLINKAEAALTPSDIDFDGLGIDELDDVLNGIKG
ncbi:MAG: hypothetical protein HQK72_16000 [Desulfamplus sp.]|nr:hypothetical protein [Desulfamplus sp.]